MKFFFLHDLEAFELRRYCQCGQCTLESNGRTNWLTVVFWWHLPTLIFKISIWLYWVRCISPPETMVFLLGRFQVHQSGAPLPVIDIRNCWHRVASDGFIALLVSVPFISLFAGRLLANTWRDMYIYIYIIYDDVCIYSTSRRCNHRNYTYCTIINVIWSIQLMMNDVQ